MCGDHDIYIYSYILGFIRIVAPAVFYSHFILCMNIYVKEKGVTLQTKLTCETNHLCDKKLMSAMI